MIELSLDGVDVYVSKIPSRDKVIIVLSGSQQIVKVMNLTEEGQCKALSTSNAPSQPYRKE